MHLISYSLNSSFSFLYFIMFIYLFVCLTLPFVTYSYICHFQNASWFSDQTSCLCFRVSSDLDNFELYCCFFPRGDRLPQCILWQWHISLSDFLFHHHHFSAWISGTGCSACVLRLCFSFIHEREYAVGYCMIFSVFSQIDVPLYVKCLNQTNQNGKTMIIITKLITSDMNSARKYVRTTLKCLGKKIFTESFFSFLLFPFHLCPFFLMFSGN